MKTEAEREKNKLDPWKLNILNRYGVRNPIIAPVALVAIAAISYSSGKSSDSYNNLMDERLEFKLESKGGLVATIVKTSAKASTAPSTSKAVTAVSAMSTTNTTVTSAASTESAENTTSSSSVDIKEEDEEFIDESIASTNEIQLDELRQQEQTRSSTTMDYEKQTDTICDVDNIGCTDSSSTFDLLRSECSNVQMETPVEESEITLALASLDRERQIIDCGGSGNIRKRSESDFNYENRTQSKQMKMEMAQAQQQQQQQQLQLQQMHQQQPEYDITDATTSEKQDTSHAISVDLKNTLSSSVSSAASCSQELSGGSNSLATSSSAIKAPTNESFCITVICIIRNSNSNPTQKCC
ncbi:unnamed protein product [Ceratitis capitata]|uniref:(Mediterranean fruit fly) hypothetical protein n=1 Tax=Ceratitis capitata TaxID=7213 RepID=A0A811VA77_CERCA|nr:unnamed protein product [Ceratitis capitata]